jgi:hypothetical protein
VNDQENIMKKLLCLTLLIGLPLLAQERRSIPTTTFASDNQTVPVMANTTGIGGATFQTYVALLNPTASAFPIDVTLYDAAGTKRNRTITLDAGEMKTYTNFLSEVFNYTGGGAATLKSAAGNRFIVNTEVRTGANRFSTSVPAIEFAGSNSRSFSPGITVDSSSRTNVGCFNQSDVANVVTATVYDNSGKQTLGTATLNLAANGWGQTAVNAIVSGGYVQFDPQEAALCYAVVVDNVTNDGRFISAAEYKP